MSPGISFLLGLGAVALGSYAVFTILNSLIDFVNQVRNYGNGIIPLLVYVTLTFLVPLFAILVAYLLTRGLSKGGKATVVVLIMITGFVGLLLFSGWRLVLE
jgi:hypothetical protein